MSQDVKYVDFSNRPTFHETLKSIFYFDTIKLVAIHSVKYGVVHRLMQLLVLAYIVVYMVWLQQGYQEYATGNGDLYYKLKGSAIVNGTGTGAQSMVLDSVDFVQPPVENNALFVTNALLTTPQYRGVCNSFQKCLTDLDCSRNSTNDGLLLPTCNVTSGKCLIMGWCPLEVEKKDSLSRLNGLENVTVFIRTSMNYKLFGVQLSDPKDPIPKRNLWPIKDMLAGASIQDCESGCIIKVTVDWSCDLNKGENQCSPKTTFKRSEGGFNYRKVRYLDDHNRVLQKLYGLRFLVSVVGRGARFSVFRVIITIGSGAAFFTIATLIVDYVIYLLYRSNELFMSKKYAFFDPEGDKYQSV